MMSPDQKRGPEPATRQSGQVRIVAVRGDVAIPVAGLHELAGVYADPETRVWIDLVEPNQAQIVEAAHLLGIHPIVAERMGERNQRARIEQIEAIVHIVLFALAYGGEIRELEIDIVLGHRFLLTAHQSAWDPGRAPQLGLGPETLLRRGPDFLLYALSDWIVDGYFPVLDELGDDLDRLEDDVVGRASRQSLETLFELKRDLLTLRRAVSPAREVFNQLTNRDLGLVAPANLVYLRDVYDHLIRVTDEIDNYRELASGTLDIYLSTVNNNLSAIMKRLTGVTVVLAGIGALAGIFGMSEAGAAMTGSEAIGFWVVTGGILGAAAIALAILRWVDWV